MISLDKNIGFEISFKKLNTLSEVVILFDYRNKINLKNLYLVFKFYINNERNFVHSIAVIGKSGDDYPVFHHLNDEKLKKISFIDFEVWFDDLLEMDWKYLSNFFYYGFRIKLYNESEICTKITNLPTLPWEKYFLHKYLSKSENLSSENIRLKKKIKLLLRSIYGRASFELRGFKKNRTNARKRRFDSK